jgi:hypothetical protein
MLKYHMKLGRNLERKVGFAVLRTVITRKCERWNHPLVQEYRCVCLPEFARQGEDYPTTL